MATHSSILAWKSHGQRSLVGCSPWGRKESGTTERLTLTNTSMCICVNVPQLLYLLICPWTSRLLPQCLSLYLGIQIVNTWVFSILQYPLLSIVSGYLVQAHWFIDAVTETQRGSVIHPRSRSRAKTRTSQNQAPSSLPNLIYQITDNFYK